MNEVPSDVGLHLRSFRAYSEYTQGDIAKLTGLTQGYVSKVEAGERAPSMGALISWCEALGITAVSLLEVDSCPVCHSRVA